MTQEHSAARSRGRQTQEVPVALRNQGAKVPTGICTMIEMRLRAVRHTVRGLGIEVPHTLKAHISRNDNISSSSSSSEINSAYHSNGITGTWRAMCMGLIPRA